MDNQISQIFNIFLGVLSALAIISGFIIKEYQVLFWSVGIALLVVVSFSYYVFDNYNKIKILNNKFKKIEESLNIYERLNKLELKMKKRGQINLIDIIKIGLAILLIMVFYQAIKSIL